jgi:hypothetical protein
MAGLPTGTTLNGGTYTQSASYDNELRLTSLSVSASGT